MSEYLSGKILWRKLELLMAKKQGVEGLLSRMKLNWPQAVTPTAELIMRIYRLNDLAFRNARQQTARHGLSFTEFEVLATLRSTASPRELAPTELYGSILVSSGGLTKMLHSLQRRRLISRSQDKNDRRSLRVRLTAAGRRVAEGVMADVQCAGGELLSAGLSRREIARLITLVRQLLLAIELGQRKSDYYPHA